MIQKFEIGSNGQDGNDIPQRDNGLIEINISVLHAPYTLHLSCFMAKQILPIIDTAHIKDLIRNNPHIMSHTSSVTDLLMQSDIQVPEQLSQFFHNVLCMPHGWMLPPGHVCIYKKQVKLAIIHP